MTLASRAGFVVTVAAIVIMLSYVLGMLVGVGMRGYREMAPATVRQVNINWAHIHPTED